MLLHVVVGPNGAGKTTFCEQVLWPVTHLPSVNADALATERWPGDEVAHAYEAARLAADERARRIAARQSFATETVFSHESEVELLRTASQAGYRITLHVVLVPEDLAAARVAERVAQGGHHVPAAKVRARYRRLWAHVHEAIGIAGETRVYDNSRAAQPFRLVAVFVDRYIVVTPRWPPWTPADLLAAGR